MNIDSQARTKKHSTLMPERVDKTLQWLEISRDSWKEKTKKAKEELKKKTLAVTRARKGREQAQQEVRDERRRFRALLEQKDREIDQLVTQLERSRRREEELKKKPWCRIL